MPVSDRRDLYDVLGVSKNASPDDIKKAFRKMAKEYHPDLHPNDKQAEEKFKEVNEAYDILSDPSKRERYDRFGFAGIDPSHGMDGASANGFDFDDMFGFGDIFSSFFGGGRGGRGGRASRQAQRYGTNIEMPLVLEFEEAVFGVEKDISVKRRVPCHECNGTGAEAGSKPETCPTCQGRGEVVRSSRTSVTNPS